MTHPFNFLQLEKGMNQGTDQKIKTPNLRRIWEIIFEVVNILIVMGALLAVFLLYPEK